MDEEMLRKLLQRLGPPQGEAYDAFARAVDAEVGKQKALDSGEEEAIIEYAKAFLESHGYIVTKQES